MDVCQQTCALIGRCTCGQQNDEEIMEVVRRNGDKVKYDAEKVNESVAWACGGVDNVNASTIALHVSNQIYDGVPTEDIQRALIKTAADMISERTPNYDIVAGRLEMMNLRKEAYGSFEPPTLQEHIEEMVSLGKYDKELLDGFTDAELDDLEDAIDHDRDMEYKYAATQQFKGKYLVQNRITGEVFETPQFAYMCLAMALFGREDNKLEWVKDYYDAISQGKISLPTPVMAGVRTPTRQFASCTVVDCGDSLDSINSANNAIVKYISQRAGIGINGGAIRSIGSEVRNGEVKHTGKIPFYKTFQASVKSSSQGYLLAV